MVPINIPRSVPSEYVIQFNLQKLLNTLQISRPSLACSKGSVNVVSVVTQCVAQSADMSQKKSSNLSLGGHWSGVSGTVGLSGGAVDVFSVLAGTPAAYPADQPAH